MSKDSDSLLAMIFDELKEHRGEFADVRHEISKLGAEIRKEINKVVIDVHGLKIKTGLWGGLAGLISGAFVVASMFLKGSIP